MPKAAAMRVRLIEQISKMLQRPGMYAVNDQDFELVCWLRLGDLRFLDDLPELSRDELGLSNKYGPSGIPGPFRGVFGHEHRYYNEVASLYAEVFHRYGYFTPDRLIPQDEWQHLLNAIDSDYGEADARLSEVVGACGPPSFKIGRWILCYAPEDRSGWIYFDSSAYEPDINDPESGSFTGGYPQDPLLRNIRLPGEDFGKSLRLTRHGRALQRRAHMQRLS